MKNATILGCNNIQYNRTTTPCIQIGKKPYVVDVEDSR